MCDIIVDKFKVQCLQSIKTYSWRESMRILLLFHNYELKLKDMTDFPQTLF